MNIKCHCGKEYNLPDAAVGRAARCGRCRSILHLTAAPPPFAPANAGDFEARLVVESGPGKAGEQFLLGGTQPIEIGKTPDKPISLPGARVSRNHARLIRVDANSATWQYEDLNSTNGSFVDGVKVTFHDLRPGDSLRIGEYHLRYFCPQQHEGVSELVAIESAAVAAQQVADPGDIYDVIEPPLQPPATPPAQLAEPEPADDGTGPLCPSCQRRLKPGAKICVQCGINVQTGRTLLTARDLDKDDLETRARATIEVLSWIIPVGPFYPIASEAFGTSKPYSIWTIAALTAIVSMGFWIAGWTAKGDLHPGRALKLWPNREPNIVSILAHDPERIRGLVKMPVASDSEAAVSRPRKRSAPVRRADDDEEAEMLFLKQLLAKQNTPEGQKFIADYRAIPESQRAIADFHWYQLITHAFLHGDILHIAGNFLFLLVFGSRVNALIGNLQAAILYPLLAIGAAVGHMMFDTGTIMIPGIGPQQVIVSAVGASGAIMGLAGMYLILFPVHKVHMVSWVRLGLLTGYSMLFKIYSLRGFWVVLLYIAFDVSATILKKQDGVAHWAHLGGFIVGVAFALILLCGRLVNARGGDLLSVLLGRHAWALIGKPSTRK